MFADWYDMNHDRYGCDMSVSAEDAWKHRLPETHENKREKWCRSYWKRKYDRDIHEAYMKRTRLIIDGSGQSVRIDMEAPGVVPTPTLDELAMAFYPNARGALVDPQAYPMRAGIRASSSAGWRAPTAGARSTPTWKSSA